MKEQKNYTVGQIAELLQEPPARIDYITRKLRIKARQRVGIFRLFDEQQVNVIKEGCSRIQIRGDR